MSNSEVKYVIDTGPIIDLKHYPDDVFVSLWENFDNLVMVMLYHQ